MSYETDPIRIALKRDYCALRSNAWTRGIELYLTLDQYIDLWRPHFVKRHSLSMVRVDDDQPFVPENMVIMGRSAAISFSHAKRRAKRAYLASIGQ